MHSQNRDARRKLLLRGRDFGKEAPTITLKHRAIGPQSPELRSMSDFDMSKASIVTVEARRLANVTSLMVDEGALAVGITIYRSQPVAQYSF